MAGVRTTTRLEELERLHRRTGHEITQSRHLGEVRRLAELYILQTRLEQAITAEGGTVWVMVPRRRRPAPRPTTPNPNAVDLLLAALEVSARDVKVWAVEQGLIPAVVRGRIRLALVEAYAAAHPTSKK